MKKLFALIAVTGMLFMLVSNIAFAQEPEAEEAATEQTDTVAAVTEPTAVHCSWKPAAESEMSLHKQVKRLFIEGGCHLYGFCTADPDFRPCSCN